MLMMESLEAIAVECMWRIWYAVNATWTEDNGTNLNHFKLIVRCYNS